MREGMLDGNLCTVWEVRPRSPVPDRIRVREADHCIAEHSLLTQAPGLAFSAFTVRDCVRSLSV